MATEVPATSVYTRAYDIRQQFVARWEREATQVETDTATEQIGQFFNGPDFDASRQFEISLPFLTGRLCYPRGLEEVLWAGICSGFDSRPTLEIPLPPFRRQADQNAAEPLPECPFGDPVTLCCIDA